MPRLIAALVRHAEYRQMKHTPSAHQPYPLTEAGRQQAIRAAKTLRDMATAHDWSIARQIHCSLLLRAWETASIIAEYLGDEQKVYAFPELSERSLGSAANLTIHQIEAVIHDDPRCGPLPSDWKSNSKFSLPLQGAESLIDAGQRVAKHLNDAMHELSQRTPRDTLMVFIGHGAAIRHASHELGVLKFEQISGLSMHHAVPIYFEYLGTKWKHIAGHWKYRNLTAEID